MGLYFTIAVEEPMVPAPNFTVIFHTFVGVEVFCTSRARHAFHILPIIQVIPLVGIVESYLGILSIS